jgi:RNA polymerase sigma-70 factor (ECF subfamily)
MTDELNADDVQLMAAITRHDQRALSALYTRYSTPVYSVTLRVLQHDVMAEEATQDTFLKVWRQPHLWDPARGKLISWLLTIARYTAIDRLRAEIRQTPESSTPLDSVPIASDAPGPDDPAWADGRLLRRLLLDLPPEQAEVIELGFFKGLTHRELSETLQLPLGTVKTRVRLGLQKLRAGWEAATREPDPSRRSRET